MSLATGFADLAVVDDRRTVVTIVITSLELDELESTKNAEKMPTRVQYFHCTLPLTRNRSSLS
jgi:hypothetical protein